MAGKTDTSATLFAQKKLLGKAHTSNLKIDGEEEIGSNIQTSSDIIFGDRIPSAPNLTLNTVQGIGSFPSVEYVQFNLVPIAGTSYDANDSGGGSGSDSADISQTAGTHAYAFQFPENYQTLTNNTKAGDGVFSNRVFLYETIGKAQLVPPFFSGNAPNPYIVKIYKEDGTQIPLLDNIDWNIDYYNGILFLQDYDESKVPAYARAFVYVGRMASEIIAAAADTGATTYGTNVLIKTAWMEIPKDEDGEPVPDGVTMVFYLEEKPEPASSLLLYVNGVLQRQGLNYDYTIVDKEIVFNEEAPKQGSYIFATYPYLYFLPTTTKWMDVPSGLSNGVNFTYTLSETPNPPSSLMLYVNGVLQVQGEIADYTVSGKIVTMNYIPKVGSNLLATYPY